MVGAADGERVERLIDYSVRKGIVERDSEKHLFGLSPEGWKMIEAPQDNGKPASSAAVPTDAPDEIIKAQCNQCGPDRNTYKRASHTVIGKASEVSWSNTYEILECCGCDEVSVRRTLWFSEWDEIRTDPITDETQVVPGLKVTHWPPETARKKPDWVENLDDDVLRRVIDEVYQALNSELIVLASIGTRTLLDRAMFLRIGDLKGGFARKFDRLVENGHIGKSEREILEAITDAGSASAHRDMLRARVLFAQLLKLSKTFFSANSC
jgi:hypothetical protein